MISNERNCVIEFDEIKRKYKKNKHFRKKNERIKPKPQMKSKHALIISSVLIKRPSLSTKVTSRLMSWYKRMNNNRKKSARATANRTKEKKIISKEVNQSEKLQNENSKETQNKKKINVKLWNSCSGLVCIA